MPDIRFTHFFLVLAGLLCSFVAPSLRAQQTPKKERFGKSLERLKWDEQRQLAIEKKPEPSSSTEAAEITLRMETLLAVFDLLVVDKQGRVITGLTKNDFEITEDGIPQQAAMFALGDGSRVPRSIVLIVDYSYSQLAYVDRSVAAAQRLVEQLKPNDRMAIVTDNVALLVPFTADKKQLKDALDGIRSRVWGQGIVGQSRQYSALLATLRELMAEEDRPIVIFQTDGDQRRAMRPAPPGLAPGWKPYLLEFGLADLHKSADLTHTTIYSIYPGLRLLGLPEEEQFKRTAMMLQQDRQAFRQYAASRLAGRGVLPSPGKITADMVHRAVEVYLAQQHAMSWLSEQTGGWLDYLETPEQADAVYARILDSINNRYILGYYPTNTVRDGRWRKVAIKVRAHPDYVVTGRNRYLVPAEAR